MSGLQRLKPLRGALIDHIADSVPGSKSVTNRALVCAALADGASTLRRVAPGDDSLAMLDCLAVLGVNVGFDSATSTARVEGAGGRLRPMTADAVLPTRLAGTTSRFVTALAALSADAVIVDGGPPLRARPMKPLHDALAALGADVVGLERDGHLPVRVGGSGVHGGTVFMPGDVSSQYLTALMLIAPYLDDGLEIRLTTPLVSRPYVELTALVMSEFGHDGVNCSPDRVTVLPGRYRGSEFEVEVDASSASYPLALAAICRGTVRVDGLGTSNSQGDAAFRDVLARMGAHVMVTDDFTVVSVNDQLNGIDLDMADISDTMPTLAAIAPFASTTTRIRGVEFIRRKETDRIRAMATELRRCGVTVDEFDDGLAIEPCSTWRPAEVSTYHDHRIAMSMALVGCAVSGIAIADPGVVSKSWPGFWDWLSRLRVLG